jgi:hypothetical protein
MKTPQQEGFSARVLLKLIVKGRRVPVSQIGPKTIRLRRPCVSIEGEMGILVIRIGKTQKCRHICLTRALPEDPREIQYY